MSITEDRLRDALTARAEPITGDQLTLKAGRPAPPAADGPASASRRPRWLLPAVAAAVVLLLVASAAVLPRLVGGRSTQAPAHTFNATPTTTPAAAPSASMPAGPRAQGTIGIPTLPALVPASDLPPSTARYLVRLDGAAKPSLVVVDATTSAVSAKHALPTGGRPATVAASPDPLTFYVATTDPFLYRLTLDAAGRVRSLTRLDFRFPAGADESWLAVSPDGRDIAVPMRLQPAAPSTRTAAVMGIDVVRIADGQVEKSFTNSYPGYMTDLSWAADGRQLAYQVDGILQPPRPVPPASPPTAHAGVWILDVSGAGDLFARSRQVVNGQLAVGNSVIRPILRPDGRSLYAIGASLPVKRSSEFPHMPHQTWLLEMSAPSGGGMTRVIFGVLSDPGTAGAGPVLHELALDPAGRQVIMIEDSDLGHAYRVDVATGKGAHLAIDAVPGNQRGKNLFAW
ncbi:hypothetical protein [Pseudofrankia asymbiotica]|uniref:Uncharacterized protein n=1 Tax=Pseudofrankia asymbiotica TaxID=1834516 RepID=A0A1V2I2N6_9ACTN|nr:hypothetical protein [Pseudofrankia asymbiotica]ONH24421.1 hypothetical protein BL253_30190 [Pseudofrankia asymbiotica]